MTKFPAVVVRNILDSLPEPVCERRREQLPHILDEWIRVDLQKHFCLDTPSIIQSRIKRIKGVTLYARLLSQALNAAAEERPIIVHELLTRLRGRSIDTVSRSEWRDLDEQLNHVNSFLADLAAIAPEKIWKPTRGQPRNFVAYLVLKDIASIFLWFTGRKPARGVHRTKRIETGPFYRFASVLWPIVFKKGTHSLPATTKNWAKEGSSYSPLIANIDARHRTWRVYEW